MKRFTIVQLVLCVSAAVALSGCSLGKAEPKIDPKAEAPPPAEVVPAGNSSVVTVDHPEQYPLVTAGKYDAAPELNVTGTVTPDISRNIPVVTIASGRVLEIHARLGDTVTKGQLLLKIQSADISGAFSDYRQAVADEVLARAQLSRAKTLLDAGAMATKRL
jgi:cobalt-zinc-cadmium efflux system membrane fusion protein